jgi:hypothetical protein
MADTTSSFDGVVDQIPPLVPAILVGGAQRDGIPLLVDVNTGEHQAFDPWNLNALRIVRSTVLMVYADIMHGKTTTAISMCERLGYRRGRGGRKLRITGDVHRLNDDVAEMEGLAQFYNTNLIDLSRYELNILDPKMKMTFPQLLGMLRRVLEHVFERKLSVAEREALRRGLRATQKLFGDATDLEKMAFVLRNMDSATFAELWLEKVAELVDKWQADQKAAALLAKARGSKHRITPGVLKACQNLASQIEELLDGEYRGVFGGQHSVSDVLEQRCVLFDYSRLSDEAKVIVQVMMWEWRAAGMVNNDPRFKFDIDIHDENHNNWQFEVYARAMHKYLKQVRSFGTFVILLTHRPQDYQSVGKKSSWVYQLATNMTRDIDMALVGRLDAEGVDAVAKHFPMSQTEKELIMSQGQGHWALFKGRNRPSFVRLELEDSEIVDTYSNKANDGMAVLLEGVPR